MNLMMAFYVLQLKLFVNASPDGSEDESGDATDSSVSSEEEFSGLEDEQEDSEEESEVESIEVFLSIMLHIIIAFPRNTLPAIKTLYRCLLIGPALLYHYNIIS